MKHLRSLKLKKNRLLASEFIIEGEKIISEALGNHKNHVRYIVVSKKDFYLDKDIPHYFCDEKKMNQISNFKTSSKALALVSSAFTNDLILSNKRLILDDIQDPGNLGTIIRSCDWYGVNHIVCSENTVECFNPKVIQASMGSIFRIPVIYCDLHKYIMDNALQYVVTSLSNSSIPLKDLHKFDAIVIGNEGNGVSKKIMDLISEKISLPKKGKAESLNASIAAGILMSHWT